MQWFHSILLAFLSWVLWNCFLSKDLVSCSKEKITVFFSEVIKMDYWLLASTEDLHTW